MRDLLLSIGAAHWVLPAMMLWPIVAALPVRLIGRDVSRDASGSEVPSGGPDARLLTAAALIVEAVLGVVLWAIYDPDGSGWQARVDIPWITDIGAAFSVGVDGLALPMVVLTALLMPLALIASWNNVRVRTPAFGALALMLTSGLVGIFISLDLLLFYLSWELMLIPMYFLIGVWGTGASARASLRYVLFTLVGSLLMLVAIMALWNLGGGQSFHLDQLLAIKLDHRAQLLMFIAFFIAFAVKSALVPFHTWLPDAQGAAPTFAAVALGLKVGTYAILRFAIPLFPAAATDPTVRSTILVLSVIAIVYGAIVAMAQRDVKRMISYSSISHLGFIMLGAFALTQQSVQGSVMVMVNHAITTSALFLLAGMLQDRFGSADMVNFGNLAGPMPFFGALFALSIFSTIGLPGTNGFVGEFLVLIGSYAEHPVLVLVATTGVIFAAVYGLRALQQVVFASAERTGSSVHGVASETPWSLSAVDLSLRERVVMGTFAFAMLYIGFGPQFILRRSSAATRTAVEAVRFGPNASSANFSVTH